MGVSVSALALALAVVYACGYGTGSLLLPPPHRPELAVAVVRLVAGLQLTAIAFLLSLAVVLPWWIGPLCLLAFALLVHGRVALVPPRLRPALTRDGIAAGVLAAILVSPVFVACARMAPGDFPPVFFNVDSPYFLEQVHALTRATAFPPESLSVAGGRFAYHFGVHAIAALVSRASGLLPHHALFLLVLPVFVIGILAAAVLVRRWLVPTLPAAVTIPLLLTAVPNFWYPFWHVLGPALAEATRFASLAPLRTLAGNYEFWGIASNTGQNLATQFIVFASIAGIAAAPANGWRLPVFLVGSAVLFKAPTGVALAGGFAAAQMWRATFGRTIRPLLPLAAVTLVFAAVYWMFWIVPDLPVTYRTQLFPLFQFSELVQQERVVGFLADLAWLLLPALVILGVPAGERGWPSAPLAVLALAPLLIVNVLRAEDLRPGRGIDYDWLQVMLPIPLLMHAFVLRVANGRWPRFGRRARLAFTAAVIAPVLPVVVMAGHYTRVLVTTPQGGHEFVDNRALGAALKAIPVEGSLIVTNDLRYPADGFSRQHRQLQVPALFGHQAFAVNYAYEAYPFSAARLELQKLLEAEHWSEALTSAAAAHGWTHLVVRNDYTHPVSIPLERMFENDAYTVYRFDRR